MCGRFAQGLFPKKLRRIIREMLDEIQGGVANLNIAPGGTAGVVVREADREPEVRRMEFGLTPAWDPKTRLFNARSETVASKPTFRHAFQTRRCIIPVLGFYEWQNRFGKKIPHYFTPADEEETPLVLGGVWDGAQFSILTTAANALMRPVHDRMPVILRPDDWLDWLNPRFNDMNHLNFMMHPAPDDALLRCELPADYFFQKEFVL